MSYMISGGAALLLLAALLVIRSSSEANNSTGKSVVVEAVTRGDDTHWDSYNEYLHSPLGNELKDVMAVTGLNNPRSDLTQNTAVDHPEQSYAGVDPTRHRAVGEKNPREAEGDSTWVTEGGENIVVLK